MQTGPSELDVIFGRAVLSYGLVAKPHLDECLKLQRQLQAAGKGRTLAQIVVQRGLINRDQYQQVVTAIRQKMAKESQPVEAPPDITMSGRYSAVQVAGLKGWKPSSGGPQLAGAPWAGGPGSDPNARTMPLQIPSTGGPARPPTPQPFLPPPTPHPSAAPPTPQPSMPPPTPQPSMAPPSPPERGPPATPWPTSAPPTSAAPAPIAPPPSTSGGGWELVSDSEPETARPLPELLESAKKKKRRDAHVRAMLNIPEHVEQFRIGSYNVLELSAAGGMGVIYRAQNEAGEVHALKALMNVEKATEKQIARFNEEGRLMNRLSHPNIVKVYEVDTYKGVPYFSMDFLEGEDFHDILRARSKTIRANVEILRAIADAVGYAHTKGVVHRDLKPSNIFVLRSGVPVLTDFGLAKNLESEYKLTAEGSMVGTPLYLSPEQVAGKAHEADGRVDVYGLGVILYQIVTGRLPFLGKNPYDVYKKILAEDPKLPTEVNEKLDKDIEKVVMTAIAKRPEERYETATEMGNDLQRWLDGEAVRCTPPPAGRRYKRKKKRKSSQRSPTQAAPEAPSLAAQAGISPDDEASSEEAAPKKERRSRRARSPSAKPKGSKVLAILIALLLIGAALTYAAVVLFAP